MRGLYVKTISTLGSACINPPFGPDDAHFFPLYENGTTVEFGETVTYVCEDG
jgi:hypothetical protein